MKGYSFVNKINMLELILTSFDEFFGVFRRFSRSFIFNELAEQSGPQIVSNAPEVRSGI